jgi:hypothetical protein
MTTTQQRTQRSGQQSTPEAPRGPVQWLVWRVREWCWPLAPVTVLVPAAMIAGVVVVMTAPMWEWPYPLWVQTSAQFHQQFTWAGRAAARGPPAGQPHQAATRANRAGTHGTRPRAGHLRRRRPRGERVNLAGLRQRRPRAHRRRPPAPGHPTSPRPPHRPVRHHRQPAHRPETSPPGDHRPARRAGQAPRQRAEAARPATRRTDPTASWSTGSTNSPATTSA